MRLVRLIISAVAVLFFLLALWVAWQVWHVNDSLSGAADDAAVLQDSLASGDRAKIDLALKNLEKHARDADERTSGTSWTLLTHTPYFGDDARGVRVVSGVISDLSRNGLKPIAESAADFDAFLPEAGRVRLETVASLQAPVASASDAFAEADRRLAAEDVTGYTGRMKLRYGDLASRVSAAASALSTADTALQLLPGMLGEDRRRNYLLVFQNNAEIRATGGLPGAVSLLQAQNGELTLSKQVAASSFGEADTPVLPLTDAEKQIYGPQLGTYFLDANFTPDFPRAADLMRARWEQVHEDPLDGVFAVDPVALSYILQATGPIRAGDVTLTSENAVDQLLHQVYLRNEDPEEQDSFFRVVAREIFENVVTEGVDDRRGLLGSLDRAAHEHRLYLHTFHEQEQALLSGHEIAGELSTDPEADPQVGVSLNDTTGAKMSYFLRTQVRVQPTACRGNFQMLSGRARLQSVAPNDAGSSLPAYVTGGGTFGIPAGDQLVAVRLHAPVGGTVEGISLNSKPLEEVAIVVQDGRPVATMHVLLKPQTVVDLTWRMATGPGQDGPVTVTVTPGIEPTASSTRVNSACEP